MSSSGSDWIDMAEGMSPADATRRGISGAILALFGVAIMVVETLGEGIGNLIGTLDDVRALIGAFFTSPIPLLEGAAEYSLLSLTQGDWAFFGPLTFVVAVVVVALSWMAWNFFDPEIPFVNNLIPWR